MKDFLKGLCAVLSIIVITGTIVVSFVFIITPERVQLAQRGPVIYANQESLRPTKHQLIDRVLGMDFALAGESRRVYDADDQLAAIYTFLDLFGEDFPIAHLNYTHTFGSFSTNTGDIIVVHYLDGRLHLHIDIGKAADGLRAHYVFILSRNYITD